MNTNLVDYGAFQKAREKHENRMEEETRHNLLVEGVSYVLFVLLTYSVPLDLCVTERKFPFCSELIMFCTNW